MTREEQVRRYCAEALATMRRHLDEAERMTIRRVGEPLENIPNRVIHALGWGHANAAQSIERAIQCLMSPELGPEGGPE
jgi:hypothetical protein